MPVHYEKCRFLERGVLGEIIYVVSTIQQLAHISVNEAGRRPVYVHFPKAAVKPLLPFRHIILPDHAQRREKADLDQTKLRYSVENDCRGTRKSHGKTLSHKAEF